MTLDPQISTTCRSSYMQIRKINSIRKFLTTNAVKTLVQSMVIVRVDYSNSLYHGLPMKSIKRLQLAHNSTARIMKLTSRLSITSPILKQLHWLPIHKRCQFKKLVFLYKVHQHHHTSANCYTGTNHQGHSDLPLQRH